MNQLEQYLSEHLLIAGVGNPLRGDDAAGLVLGEKLAAKLHLPYLCCEEVPENYITEMIDSEADSILIVDAVDFGAAPGYIDLVSPQQLSGESISTHNCSVSLLATVLEKAASKRMMVLGIQPNSLGWGHQLSQVIAEAIDDFVTTVPDDDTDRGQTAADR